MLLLIHEIKADLFFFSFAVTQIFFLDSVCYFLIAFVVKV